MNDRPPTGSENAPSPYPDATLGHYASYDQQLPGDSGYAHSYDTSGYGTTYATYQTPAHGTAATGHYDTDPLFGSLPADTGYDTGTHDTTAWSATYGGTPPGTDPYGTGGHGTGGHGTGGQGTGSHGTGSYDTTAVWTTAGYDAPAGIPAQAAAPAPEWDPATSGSWPSTSWQTGNDTASWDTTAWSTGTEWDTAAAWSTATDHPADTADALSGGHFAADAYTPEHTASEQADPSAAQAFAAQETTTFTAAFDPYEEAIQIRDQAAAASSPESSGPRPGGRAAARVAARGSRRRTPAKRSALLTVAVPSACVMGVAGIAAASVGDLTGGGSESAPDTTTQAAATVKPAVVNSKLDTQLTTLTRDAEDFADRASRTQERLDLKDRQEAERERKKAEAARKEALRPKFALPVKQKGLSAYYGQAGINWMSVHTGIDFPASYGAPVMAATDGTVRTQIDRAYGNMVIVTAADGTETWYCHLSSSKVRSGPVKAGDVIGYVGDSGNSTGAHLHFEVRPGGGSSIDPLVWLRSHGLNPT